MGPVGLGGYEGHFNPDENRLTPLFFDEGEVTLVTPQTHQLHEGRCLLGRGRSSSPRGPSACTPTGLLARASASAGSKGLAGWLSASISMGMPP